MSDYSELKRAAEACKEALPLRYMESHGSLYIRNDQGIVFDVHQNRSFPEFMAANKAYADLMLAASPAAVLALIAENERLTAQWGGRPAYRTAEYESKRDSMWRRAHMVATSKGYDHINMAIAAAPNACADCMGCGGEWQGDGVPSAVCETCKGSRGKTLEAERDQLKAENAGLKTGHEAYAQVVQGLRAEVEALRRDLVDWQEVVAAVKREVPERFTSHARGNAPGHGHSISGVWDDDNGALAGKECAWCKAWSAAMSKGEQS